MQSRWFKVLLTLSFLWLAVPVSAEIYSPKVGRRHPNFTLPRISDRQPMSLSQFRGKKVLLIQFASW
jgi:hypothetical protein